MSKRAVVHHNLYLDTNVYLTFFHFTKDDLTSLRKLESFINSGNIVLFLPEQTINEFRRNRETRINDALTRLKESRLNDTFPRIALQYKEYNEMQAAIRSFEKNKSQLLEKIHNDAQTETLKADDVIGALFDKAALIESDEEIYQSAVKRFNSGNPPGKNGSYGDAINWESLLREVPDGQDLHFVSEDGDYYSKLNSANFNSFLLKEWGSKKSSKVLHYKTLAEFLKANLPDIEITSETEKDIVIMSLSTAGTYASAKDVVRKLRQYDNFSVQQLNDITEAFTSNNQIFWIGDDYVIRAARREVIDKNERKIDKAIFKDYQKRYKDL